MEIASDENRLEKLRASGFSAYEFKCYVGGQDAVAYTAGSPFLPRLYAPSASALLDLCERRVREAVRTSGKPREGQPVHLTQIDDCGRREVAGW